MNHSNPFSQWGSNGNSSRSLLGALPSSVPVVDRPIQFHFSLSPDLLNCTVLGPKSTVCYTVNTNPQLPGYTVIRDSRSKNIGLVEWQKRPLIEIRSTLSKKPISNWLILSADACFRTMEVAGKEYRWCPDNAYINLFTTGQSRLLARISRVHNGVGLEVSEEVIQRGLLDSVICATVLLQSGKHID